MTGYQRTVTHFEKITGTEASYEGVTVSGSNVGSSGHNFVAVSCFSDFNPANAIKALCKSGREALGHMLDCHNSRAVAWHLFENLKERFGTSGGRTDGDDFVPVPRRQRGDGRRNHNISIVIARTFLAKLAKLCHARRRSRPHGVFEQNSGLFQKSADAYLRFRNDIDCADFQSANGGFGSGSGQTRTNHDWHGILGHEFLEKGQPVHPRHFQIQKDHIREKLLHLVKSDERISRHIYTKSALFGEYRHQDLPHDARIIDNEDIYKAGAICRRL